MQTIISPDARKRYEIAYQKFQLEQYPSAVKQGGYLNTKYPDIRKANGLTQFCVNYLTWSGNYGNRINTMGRLVDGVQRTESGLLLQAKKWLPSTTRKGTADIHGIYFGRHLSIEVKVGKDRVSSKQVEEKARIERAGGLYFIVTTPDDFFLQLDRISVQHTLF